MNNKRTLELITISEELLNNYADITRITDKKMQKKNFRRVIHQVNKVQHDCNHPYVFASTSLDGKDLTKTCLVCGKIADFDAEKVINQDSIGINDIDMTEEYAAEKLKEYLEQNPELSESDIRELLGKDIKKLNQTR